MFESANFDLLTHPFVLDLVSAEKSPEKLLVWTRLYMSWGNLDLGNLAMKPPRYISLRDILRTIWNTLEWTSLCLAQEMESIHAEFNALHSKYNAIQTDRGRLKTCAEQHLLLAAFPNNKSLRPESASRKCKRHEQRRYKAFFNFNCILEKSQDVIRS